MLVIGILALSAVFGAVLGIVAGAWPGPIGMATFGLLGVLASLGTPNATIAAIPSVAAAVAGALALRAAFPPRRWRPSLTAPVTAPARPPR